MVLNLKKFQMLTEKIGKVASTVSYRLWTRQRPVQDSETLNIVT